MASTNNDVIPCVRYKTRYSGSMSDYTVSQIGPLSDWMKLEGVAPGKKFIEGELESAFIGISVNVTEPGGESPFWHTHSKIEEIYVFLEGTGEIALDDEVLPIEAGTVVRVGTDTWRALRCLPGSDVPLRWLCIRGGGDTLATIGNDADIDQERPFPWN